MFSRRSIVLSVTCAALALFVSVIRAADPPSTTITIQGMHCAGCASKVSTNLQTVSGVQNASADAAKSLAVITAKSDANPSPKALWEAVEKAGYKPTKLVGPSGTFTAKPKL